jgi:hypothetical protein
MKKTNEPAPFVYSNSPDAGERWLLNDEMGKPVNSWDSRGHVFTFDFDALNRPTNTWVDEGSGNVMVSKTVYGESLGATLNMRGQVVEQYDQSGKVSIAGYDFKGNPLSNKREFAEDYTNTLDWNATTLPTLSAEAFTESTTYDGMDRPITVNKADGSTCTYTYNEAAILETLE